MSSNHAYTPAPIRDSLELDTFASPTTARSSSDLSAHSPTLTPIAGSSSRPTRTSRTYSISSAFDFNTTLLPLSTSADSRYQPLGAPTTSTAPPGSLEKQKTLSYINGLSLLIGLQIGSGIFSSPSQVNNHVPGPGVALIIWALAGLLAWTGAASYAELGGAIPLNGGSGVYLRHCFGELAGFLFSWTAVIVLKPGSAAIIAIISGEYFNRVIFGSFEKEYDTVLPGVWANKIAALVALGVVTAINVVSTRLTTRVGDVMLVVKVVLLVGITVTGIVVAVTGKNADGSVANKEWREVDWFRGNAGGETIAERMQGQGERVMGGLGEYAIALYAGLWAFDGWDNVNYVTGEMRHASRDLPRVIHTAMPTVIISYLLANIAYYFVLPTSTISSSNTIAVAFGSTVFGPTGGLLLALAVSLSCFGALNASTFTSGRLVYVAGKEGYLPAIFGRLGLASSTPNSRTTYDTTPLYHRILSHILPARFRPDPDTPPPWTTTPIPAMLLNFLITAVYIIVGEFSTLLTFYGVAGYAFYFLTVLGLIVLRFREPDLERPYKTWIVTPVVFCCVSLFLIGRSVVGRPIETLIVAAFVAAGVPVWWVRSGKKFSDLKGVIPRWKK